MKFVFSKFISFENCLRWCAACIAIVTVSNIANAELTSDHRRELSKLKRDLSRVGALLRRDKFDDAEETIEAAEERIDEIVEEAEVERDDRGLRAILLELERQKSLLDKSKNPTSKDSSKVSFVDDIAPLIDSKCLGCHGANNPRAGLRLDTFANWRRGGRSGSLLVPGNPARSLLIGRLTATDPAQRMPQRGEPLSKDEVQTIAKWIGQGAKFEGGGANATLGDLIYAHEMKTLEIKIPKPAGNETVSFTRDMAPWMSNLCLNCHNSRNKSGGLSVETFYDLMKGGDSGEVIIPGDQENSRFFRLVGGLELPRMPQGQARITRKNYEDMKKWFAEGNTFDGADPRTNIRTYIRTEAEMMADAFRSKTEEEMQAHRKEQTELQLRRSVPNDPQRFLESEHFLLAGNVSDNRLKEVSDWAEKQLEELHKLFGGSGKPWRGRLAVFVLKDRFSYDEFNEVIEERRVDREMVGHSNVSTSQENAYVVIQDLGDQNESGVTTEQNLSEHLTGAYLRQSGSVLPNWLVRGTGLVMALTGSDANKQRNLLKQSAAGLVKTLDRPQNLFAEGTFSPSAVGPVGFALVSYLLQEGGSAKFAQLASALQQGRTIDQACQAAYGVDATQIARRFAASLAR